MVARARELAVDDPAMAAHLIDWAWFADPSNRETGRAVLEVYTSRIVHDTHNTQEVLMYLDHMTDVQLAVDGIG